MAKQKKSRKSKKYTPKKYLKPAIKDETLPPDHRYDKEIADICSATLIKVQMRRLEQPTSIERELRKELRTIVGQRRLSRVATDFFDSIIDIFDDQPFVKAATRILNATYNEYVVVEKHMATLSEISMQKRVQGLIDDTEGKGWHVERLSFEDSPLPIDKDKFITVHQDWHKKFDDDGNLLETMSIAVKTENIGDFIENAYVRGLLIQKVNSQGIYYHFKIHPENNIPGIPLSPPSIQAE